MYRAYILLIALFAGAAHAKIYQCADGSFQDAPCEDQAGVEVEVNTGDLAAPKAEIWDGLQDVETVDVADPSAQTNNRVARNLCQLDYTTRSAINEGLRTWKVVDCMSMAQVEKVTRGRGFQEYTHQNGYGEKVTEWVFAGKERPRRVTFINGKVSNIR